MLQTNLVYAVLINSLFILAVVLVLLGLSLLFFPEKTISVSVKMNRWINTDRLFDVLNKPHYQERLIYRHHRLFGALVMFFTMIFIYMMFFYMDHTILLNKILLLTDSAFSKWLTESLFYILVMGNILAFIIGLVIFIRPSTLKKLEYNSNKWVETDEKLKFLDNSRDLPESYFLRYPRIFGTVIIAVGMYMMMNTQKFLT